MTYTAAHQYLTVHWQVAGSGEVGQFGLRFFNSAEPTQSDVDGAAAAVQTMWSAATSNIPNYYQLVFLRLARIQPNGKYASGFVPFDHVYSPVVAGGRTSPTIFPLAVAHAVTLRTATPRGVAHAGRIYMPPLGESMDSPGTWAPAVINSRLNTLASMLSALSGSPLGTLQVMSKGTAAFPGGVSRDVTFIRSDNRPDTQRRRARQQTGITQSSDWTVS